MSAHTMKISLAALVAAMAMQAELHAQTINWGNSINPEGIPGFQEMSFDSGGIAIDQTGTTYTFELGAFADGFLPMASNIDLWGTNWLALDSASYSAELNYFTGSYNLQPSDAPLAGSRAYIWVYNNTLADETSEWFLATGNVDLPTPSNSNWVIPDYVGSGGGSPPGTFDWRLSTASDPIWGGLNGVAGGGERTVDPGVFELQTFAGAVVPEPAAAILALLGASGVLFGRRRQAHRL